MTYLATPRIAFSGHFMSDVSTRNNDPDNYAPNTTLADQWNPRGGATFDLVGCRVTGGAPLAPADPATRLAATGAPARPSGKMVDLDPACQWASEIWGFGLRLFNPQTGQLALAGDFAVASFRDLYVRQVRELRAGRLANGQPSGARYVSVLENVEWGPLADNSPLLSALRAASAEGGLAIALHTFGYFYTATHPRHATGSVIGIVGPRSKGEPRTVVVARRLQTVVVDGLLPAPGGGFRPGALFGPIDFEIDAERRVAHFDVGHACLIDDVDGTISDVSTILPGLEDISGLAIGLLPADNLTAGANLPEGSVRVVADLDVLAPDWYRRTGGIVDADLPEDVADLAEGTRFALYARLADAVLRVLSVETHGGRFFRADDFVRRLDPGDPASVPVHARLFGRPAAGLTLQLRQVAPDADAPGLAVPASVITDARGTATVALSASDPGNPRGPIDGEVFVVAYATAFDGEGNPVLPGTGLGGLDLIAAHVRDAFAVAQPVAFNTHIRPIMAQYARLYPIMSVHLFDLADYEALVRHRQPLLLAFQRPIGDPNYMPVTRDLSRAKLDAIISWLRSETGDPAEPLRRGPGPPPSILAEEEAAHAKALRAVAEDAKSAAARAFGIGSGVFLDVAAMRAPQG